MASKYVPPHLRGAAAPGHDEAPSTTSSASDATTATATVVVVGPTKGIRRRSVAEVLSAAEDEWERRRGRGRGQDEEGEEEDDGAEERAANARGAARGADAEDYTTAHLMTTMVLEDGTDDSKNYIHRDGVDEQRAERRRAAIRGRRVEHVDITCDGCEMEPIEGTRWRCVQCEDRDLCGACHRALTAAREKGVDHLPQHVVAAVPCLKHELRRVQGGAPGGELERKKGGLPRGLIEEGVITIKCCPTLHSSSAVLYVHAMIHTLSPPLVYLPPIVYMYI